MKHTHTSSTLFTSILSRLLSAVVAMILFSAACALADDSYVLLAGGSSRAGAVSISMNQTYAAEITAKGQNHWYRFTTPAEPGYTVFRTMNNSVDEYMDFYVRTGIEEIKSHAMHYRNSNSGSSLRLDPNTTYYIQVSTRSSTSGFFRVGVWFNPDREGSSFGTAVPVSLGREYHATMDGTDDHDYFAVTPAETGDYTLTGRNDNIGYWLYWGLYTADNKDLGSSYTSGNFTKTYTLQAGTTYYLAFSVQGYKTGDYHFTVSWVPTSIKSYSLSYISSYSYRGSAITPEVTVEGDGKTLQAGTDYTVSCKNNVNAGKATLTVTGTGKYQGTLTGSFTITPVSLKSAKVPGSGETYTGKTLTPDPTVTATVNGKAKTLTKGTDYTVSYKNNVNTGTAAVTVKGKGNYTGTLDTSFVIKAAPISLLSLSGNSFAYTGKAITPTVTVKNSQGASLSAGTDYAVSYSGNKNAGTATVTVTGKGNYTGTLKTTFSIYYDLNGAEVTLSKTEFTYTGKAVKPGVKSVTLKVNGKSVKIKASDGYTVEYENSDPGNHRVILRGKGKCQGFATADYTVKPAKPKDLKLKAYKGRIEVKWTKSEPKKQGYYEIRFSTKKNVKTGSVITTQNMTWNDAMLILKPSQGGKCLTGLSSRTTYYVWVRHVVNGVAGDWSAVKSIKSK